MKNILVLSLLILVAFVSCEKGKTATESTTEASTETLNNAKSFSVDSIKVNDSLKIDKNLTVAFRTVKLSSTTITRGDDFWGDVVSEMALELDFVSAKRKGSTRKIESLFGKITVPATPFTPFQRGPAGWSGTSNT